MAPIKKSTAVKMYLHKKTRARFCQCKGDVLDHVPYKPTHNIHAGDNSQVFLMERRKRKEFLAAKVFNLEDEDFSDKYLETFKRETGILQELKHENIVKCRLSITSPTLGVIFMDYIPEGPIRQHLKSPLLYKNVHRYFIQISSALRHVHSKHIVHRDISLDNILVKNNTAYLADFGLARKLPEGSTNMFGLVGTLGFQAPEVRDAKLTTGYDGYKADSYSLGAILWCLLTKEEPDHFFTDLYFDIAPRENVDPILKECALGLLQNDPMKRWHVDTMLDSLQRRGYHSWYIQALLK